MELPPSFTSSTSSLKRLPAQTSQGTNTLARNTISTSTCPAPSQASHRPPATLNENVLGGYALARASGSAANRARSSSNALMYVMGLERGVRPMGAWSTSTTSLIASQPSSACTSPTGSPRCCFAPCVPVSRDSSCRNSTSCTRVDFPDPDTPVTAVSVPTGMRVSTPWRLCRRAPLTSSQRRAGRRADGTPMRFSPDRYCPVRVPAAHTPAARSEEHTSELQSPCNLVCRLL